MTDPFTLSISDAERLARQFRSLEGDEAIADDPLPHIKPSLLSAEHIIEYVKKTGLIAPFSADTSKGGRLKKASYEARLSQADAYIFENPNPEIGARGVDPKVRRRNSEGNLVLPPNSIVFVQCDLEFRLPPFIALRFNLSISHVHRGLLLGTGPLVDPGFWGNLCIPIHNLTDEEYEIEKDDGLIWIEFTKTSSDTKHTGRLPSGDGNWDIKEFIVKAQRQVSPNKDRVGIRSGITDALNRAEKAATLLTESNNLVKEAQTSAKSAEANVKRLTLLFSAAAVIGLLTVGIGVSQLTQAYYSDTGDRYNELRHIINDTRDLLSKTLAEFGSIEQKYADVQSSIAELSASSNSLSDNDSMLFEQLQNDRSERLAAEAALVAEIEANDGKLRRLVSALVSYCMTAGTAANAPLCNAVTAAIQE